MARSYDVIRCCHLGFAMSGPDRRVLIEAPAAENLPVESVREEYPGGAMVNLNRHEAGSGGHSQGKPAVRPDSSTRREAMLH